MAPTPRPRRSGPDVHVGRSSDLRASGTCAAGLLASLPGSESQCVMTRSFPITAAGQSRIRTGFPLAAPDAAGAPTQWMLSTHRAVRVSRAQALWAQRC